MALPDKKNKVIINGEVLLYEAKGPYVKSGTSILGAIEYDPDEDKIRCHQCGKWFNTLGTHIRTHGMTGDQYKTAHGLAVSAALVNERLRRATVERSKRNYEKLVASGEWERRMGGQHKHAASARRGKRCRGKKTPEFQNSLKACPAQILEKLRSIKEAVGRTPSMREIREHGLYQRIIEHRFGSVRQAMVLAGLVPRTASQELYSKKLLTEMLRNFIGTRGYVPTLSDCRRGLLPSGATFTKHFGSWRSALKSAGKRPFSDKHAAMRAKRAASVLHGSRAAHA